MLSKTLNRAFLLKTLNTTLNQSCKSLTRTIASSSNFKENFIVENKGDFAVLKLNRAPVNSLNLDFLTSLSIQLDKFEENKSINGVIITSNVPKIFSAGLDIMEMYKCKAERARTFWKALQDLWIKLYGSNKVYIAAINGHAPAGGCLLAMSCDYRIMAKGPYAIGLNETLLGITAPFWFSETMQNVIGNRETEKALQLGLLYSDEEALNIKLIDEVAKPEDLMTRAEETMKKWLKIPVMARELTKSSLRRNTVNKLISQREADVEAFVQFATKESVQKSLGKYLEALKNRGNKPSN